MSENNHIPLGDIAFLDHIATNASPAAARALLESVPGAIFEELEKISNALVAKDSVALKSACHSLRGACYSIQATRLAETARQMEEKASDLGLAQDYLDYLQNVGAETVDWWTEFLDGGRYLEASEP
ncbi:Hpt domain-containing protein [Sneathiella sp.]|jgi:HPt (histidine-containing phosphotransfer) domain-containing protein|uniref:Hpt domain-containing protein n=1 Tax=Sneathiella sp. TaxID=1964365 RepID=UPI0039E6B222